MNTDKFMWKEGDIKKIESDPKLLASAKEVLEKLGKIIHLTVTTDFLHAVVQTDESLSNGAILGVFKAFGKNLKFDIQPQRKIQIDVKFDK
jgi:hypothetical protein